MYLSSMVSLALFVLVATLSPGGATTLATASGAHFGLRRSIPLIGGVSAGLASMAALAAAGLAAVLLSAPALQTAMKLVGSAYLLLLAWRVAHGGRPNLDRGVARPASFLSGVGLLWINPKAWAMTLAAAASFSAVSDSVAGSALLLGFTFGLASILSLACWCVAGKLLARALRTDRDWKVLNIVLGVLLVVSTASLWL